MDHVHAALAHLQSAMLYRIGDVVPVWFVAFVVTSAMANQAVKAAHWTNATRFIEVSFRFILKLPAVGVFIATVPVLGDLMRYLANDPTNLPPTLPMRVRRYRALKKLRSAPPTVIAPPQNDDAITTTTTLTAITPKEKP